MTYDHILYGSFINRPNRFLANVDLDGRTEICHVKNTSRLQELLLPGVPVSVQRAANPGRKTQYTLVAVQHGKQWVNLDSTAPNKLFGEWAVQSGYFGEITLLRPETVYGKSRFDYYLEAAGRRIFVEVKGVTLVEEGLARFPGAPTLRGLKHLHELGQCLQDGYEAIIAFIIKRSDVCGFAPNDEMQPAFGAALRSAVKQGVQALALDCEVAPDQLRVCQFVDVML